MWTETDYLFIYFGGGDRKANLISPLIWNLIVYLFIYELHWDTLTKYLSKYKVDGEYT